MIYRVNYSDKLCCGDYRGDGVHLLRSLVVVHYAWSLELCRWFRYHGVMHPGTTPCVRSWSPLNSTDVYINTLRYIFKLSCKNHRGVFNDSHGQAWWLHCEDFLTFSFKTPSPTIITIAPFHGSLCGMTMDDNHLGLRIVMMPTRFGLKPYRPEHLYQFGVPPCPDLLQGEPAVISWATAYNWKLTSPVKGLGLTSRKIGVNLYLKL